MTGIAGMTRIAGIAIAGISGKPELPREEQIVIATAIRERTQSERRRAAAAVVATATVVTAASVVATATATVVAAAGAVIGEQIIERARKRTTARAARMTGVTGIAAAGMTRITHNRPLE